MKMHNESADQLADAVRLKVVKCGNAYPDGRIKEVLFDGLPATFRRVVRMFWGREPEAHVTKLA